MATQAQLDAIAKYQATGDVSGLVTEYPTKGFQSPNGTTYDIDGKNPYELKAAFDEGGVLTPPHIPGVRIRYTASSNILTASVAAVGGTATLTDNGDRTYDLWSDDDCTFIGLEEEGYYTSYNVTKVEILKGSSLMTFKHDGNSITYYTFANTANEILWSDTETSNLINMSYMFASLSSLTKLDISKLDAPNVIDMSYAFLNSVSLIGLTLNPNFDTSKVTDMKQMFRNTNLTDIDLCNFDFSSVTDLTYAFADTYNLTNITHIDTATNSANIDASNMFSNSNSIQHPTTAEQSQLLDTRNGGLDYSYNCE